MSTNSKILSHPAYDAKLVAKCRASNFSDADTIDLLNGFQADQAQAKAAQQSDNTQNAMMAARLVGERLGSRKALHRAENS